MQAELQLGSVTYLKDNVVLKYSIVQVFFVKGVCAEFIMLHFKL